MDLHHEMHRFQDELNNLIHDSAPRQWSPFALPSLQDNAYPLALTGDNSRAMVPGGGHHHRRGHGQMVPFSAERFQFHPKVDVQDGPRELVVYADLPGVAKEDLQLSVDNGVLKFSGSRHKEATQDTERFHMEERHYGSFSRAFRLPKNAKTENITAEFKDGVMTIKCPKEEEAVSGRQITIN